MLEVAALLRAQGVTTTSVYPLPPVDFPFGLPGCVGTRRDIGGTLEEAACLVQVLGPGYFADPTGCNGDGIRHTVMVR